MPKCPECAYENDRPAGLGAHRKSAHGIQGAARNYYRPVMGHLGPIVTFAETCEDMATMRGWLKGYIAGKGLDHKEE